MKEIPLREAVARMVRVDGLYVVTDPRAPGAVVPLAVIGGKIWSMKRDSELDPERFVEGSRITGPVYQFPR